MDFFFNVGFFFFLDKFFNVGLLRLRVFFFSVWVCCVCGNFFSGVGLLGWMIGVGLLDRCRTALLLKWVMCVAHDSCLYVSLCAWHLSLFAALAANMFGGNPC